MKKRKKAWAERHSNPKHIQEQINYTHNKTRVNKTPLQFVGFCARREQPEGGECIEAIHANRGCLDGWMAGCQFVPACVGTRKKGVGG